MRTHGLLDHVIKPEDFHDHEFKKALSAAQSFMYGPSTVATLLASVHGRKYTVKILARVVVHSRASGMRLWCGQGITKRCLR